MWATTFTGRGERAVENALIYERRFGARNQIEAVVPIAFQQRATGDWNRGIGDVALAFKRTLYRERAHGADCVGRDGGDPADRQVGARGLGNGYTVYEPFAMWGQMLPRNAFLQMHGGVELPTDSVRGTGRFVPAHGDRHDPRRGPGFGRAWSPQVEVLWARPEGGAAEWDVVPQMQVTLSKLQHVMIAAGVRLPLTQRQDRPCRRSSTCLGLVRRRPLRVLEVRRGRRALSSPSAVDVARSLFVTLRADAPQAPGEPAPAAPVAAPTPRCSRRPRLPRLPQRPGRADRRGCVDRRVLAGHRSWPTPRATPTCRPASAARRSTIRCMAPTSRTSARPATCRPPRRSRTPQVGNARFFAHLSAAGGDATPSTGSRRTACRARSAIRLPPTASAPARASTATSWSPRRSPTARGAPSAPSNPDQGRRRIMHSVTGFEQEQAPHIRESELCATCHTLDHGGAGPDGRVIGSLPEQMNYQEWRHSAFVAEQRGCQSCHMPRGGGPGAHLIRARRLSRQPLAPHVRRRQRLHARLMNRYRAELGIEATAAELEATARATVRQLEADTATIELERAPTGRATRSPST